MYTTASRRLVLFAKLGDSAKVWFVAVRQHVKSHVFDQQPTAIPDLAVEPRRPGNVFD